MPLPHKKPPHTDDAREARGLVLAAKPGAIKKITDHEYRVRSTSGRGWYTVHCIDDWFAEDSRWSCTCEDYTSRDSADLEGSARPCKHIAALRVHLSKGQSTLAGVVTQERVTYGQKWSEYNAAQQAEATMIPALLWGLVEGINDRSRRTGRKPVPLREQVYVAVIKVLAQKSARRAQGLLQRGVELGHLSRPWNYTTFSRFLTDERTTQLLYDLLHTTGQVVSEVETVWAADSTGFKTTTFGAYYGEKHNHLRGNTWLKAHFLVGTTTHMIGACRITDPFGKGVGDPTVFPDLLMIARDFGLHVREVLADNGYNTDQAYRAAAALGSEPLIDFKEGQKRKAFASDAWKRAHSLFTFNHKAFSERYHKRSNVESAISAMKRKLGEEVLSKKRVAQENELLCKLIAYNLGVVVHEYHQGSIIVPDWSGRAEA